MRQTAIERVKRCIDKEVKLRKYRANKRVYIQYDESGSHKESEAISKQSES